MRFKAKVLPESITDKDKHTQYLLSQHLVIISLFKCFCFSFLSNYSMKLFTAAAVKRHARQRFSFAFGALVRQANLQKVAIKQYSRIWHLKSQLSVNNISYSFTIMAICKLNCHDAIHVPTLWRLSWRDDGLLPVLLVLTIGSTRGKEWAKQPTALL